ncbi:sensor histidine kinase [Algoriphagus lacus]|uniref:histidine kinase n=1 Tax=Algoriphagus lacus TaxID=2056311 RepID=A0A418PMB6_9BACT|nr:sensor histidine kinase [Algoriphagus lacus]RIW12545.1 sensor histidine kinase [Algoriphagus lacus]
MRDALIQRTIDQLSSINILKNDLIKEHFRRSHNDLQALELEHKFLGIYQSIAQDAQNKSKSTNTEFGEISELLKVYEFKNLYLLDTNFQSLFSTKEKNLYPLSKESLESLLGTKGNLFQIIDASAYSESKETLLYYYIPIVDENQVVGSILVEEDFQKIQDILLENTGMGNTGESYFVAGDYRLRSTSRFFPDVPPLTISVDTESIRNAFQGLSKDHIIADYRGKKVLSVQRQIENTTLDWMLISEMDFDEAMAPIIELRNYLIGITLIILLLIVLITYFLSNAIARPILELKNIVFTLSKGIIPNQTPLTSSTDEIIQITKAINELTDGLKRTTDFAQEIGSGNFKTSFKTLSDFDMLGQALLHMRDELLILREKETKLEREKAIALLQGQEKERRRIIQELHDGVGQMLTVIRMQVDSLEADNESKAEIKNQINNTVNEVKRISYNVMPHALIDYGLEAALRGLCDHVKKYSSITVDFQYVKDIDRSLTFEMSIALFRIVQEALTNIVKHAHATKVSLHVLDKEDEVYVVVEDNGRGFVESEVLKKDGLGLRNIRERANLLDGYTEIHSSSKGTSIEVHIPIPTT